MGKTLGITRALQYRRDSSRFHRLQLPERDTTRLLYAFYFRTPVVALLDNFGTRHRKIVTDKKVRLWRNGSKAKTGATRLQGPWNIVVTQKIGARFRARHSSWQSSTEGQLSQR